MNREQVERGLRQRLASFRLMPGVFDYPLSAMQQVELAESLLPWIMEMLEEARNEGRTEPLWET